MKNYAMLVQVLAPFAERFDSGYWGELCQQVENLESALSAAREENRNLRIAVVGQMKAGKSSFLNAAFFGHDLLPKADTPMTAALTKIAYSEHPSAKVVFYTEDDWAGIQAKAAEYERRYAEVKREMMEANASPFGKPLAEVREPSRQAIEAKIGVDFRASRELVEKARAQGLNLSELLGQTRTLNDVDDAAGLATALHEYVGSGGRFTAITKMTELYVDLKELQGLEIYDTPGFNDPVVSRGQQTRNFLGKCDVVFLLSSLSQFLGSSDLSLLRDQLRDAGIEAKAVILVGSQLDLALRQSRNIMDTAREMVSRLPQEQQAAGTVAAMIYVLSKHMNSQTQSIMQEYLRKPDLDEGSRRILMALQKRDPLYISAWCATIADKFDHLAADDQEQLQALCRVTGYDFQPDSLRSLSHIESVRKAVLDQRHIKAELLQGKERLLMEGAALGIKDKLDKMLAALRQRIEQINNGDIARLQSLQKDSQKRILQGRGKLEAVFDSCLCKVQSDFALLKTEVRSASMNCRVEAVRETETESYEVSTSKWWNPLSWGGSKTCHREVVTIYASAHDAIEKVERFALDTRRELQRTMMSLVNIQALRLEVIQAAMALFDTGSADFDGDLMMLEVEKSLRRITIPEVDFGDKDYSALISGKFSSDRVSEGHIDGLRKAQQEAVQAVMRDLEGAVNAKMAEISGQLTVTGKTFVNTLVRDLETGLGKLCEDINNKEQVLKSLAEAEMKLKEVCV